MGISMGLIWNPRRRWLSGAYSVFVWVVALVWSDLVWDGGNQTEFSRRMRVHLRALARRLRSAYGVWDARENKLGESRCRAPLGWGGRVFDSVVFQLDSWPDLLSVHDPITKSGACFFSWFVNVWSLVVGVVGGFRLNSAVSWC